MPPNTAPVSRWGGGLETALQPPSFQGLCSVIIIEARQYRGVWGFSGSSWKCELLAGHDDKHRSISGRRTQSEQERLLWIERREKWERLGRPQPDHPIAGKEGFGAWIDSLHAPVSLRSLASPGIKTRDSRLVSISTVRTVEDLKEVVRTYANFGEFAFDVETRAGRNVRMLQPQHRALSRFTTQAAPCPSCGRPIPSRRRIFCSDVCRSAAEKDRPALDTQTNEVWCLSLAGPGVSHVIPMGHPDSRPQLHRADVFEALAPLFFSDRCKINQNVGFDLLSIAKYYGNRLPPPPYADVMTMVFLINENLGRYNLGALSEHYLGFKYAEKLGEEAYRVEWERAMTYSITDAKMAWMLWWKLSPVLKEKPALGKLFDLEMKVLRVLLDMRRTGAYVDVDGFRRLRPVLEDQLTGIADDIRAMVGHPINLNSTQQLAVWLYDELGLPCMFRTDKGQRSTAAKALKMLARRHKAPRQILAYKDVAKLLSTYIAGYIPTIDPDSRIRASFNQARAKTGRLSCSEPNLQNIPARYRQNTEGTMVRQLFVAPPGRVLIVADYSQIELRILAHQTKDKMLLYAYTHGLDLHLQTAALIWRIPQDQVTVEQRAIAKNSNFNLAFEGGPGRIMDMSGINRTEADKVYDAWHRAYPGVKRWGNEMKRFCLHHGYVQTLYGRKRRLPDIRSSDSQDQHYAERQAVNHPIQGTAADIAKIGIIQVHQALREFHAALTLQIHDEFVIECDEAEVDDAIPFIRTAMEDIRLDGHPVLDVPLEVNIGVGKNWAEAK